MVNNIGVTLLNKAAFASVDFPYPWFLSAIHMLCNYVGCCCIFLSLRCGKISRDGKVQEPLAARLLGGHIDRKELSWNGYMKIFAFSFLFSLNIAIGNVSLKFVSVNFNQVMRSLVPAITIVLGLCMGKTFSNARKLAVVPIIMGVAMACFGDMSYTAIGFFITMFCVVLAALKAVVAGEMLTGDLKLHPVDLLSHMAPLSMIQCLLVAFGSGELQSFSLRWTNELSPFTADVFPMLVVIMSGLASFTLNISSLQANKLTSPLTLCIAANVKQVLMICLGTYLFHTVITPINGLGIVVVLMGSAWYSYISVIEKPATQVKNEKMIKRDSSSSSTHTYEMTSKSDDEDSWTEESNISHDEELGDEGASLVQSVTSPISSPLFAKV